MKKLIGLLFAGLLSMGACVMTGSAFAQSGLKSIESYIHAFVERNGFYQKSGPNGEFYSERDHIVFDGCNVTIHVLTVGADKPPYTRESVNLDVLFNLKDMNPKVVTSPKDLNDNTLPNNREWVILRTADGYRSIAIRRGTSIASPISVFPMQGGVNDAESQKLADAFSHAIAICSQK